MQIVTVDVPILLGSLQTCAPLVAACVATRGLIFTKLDSRLCVFFLLFRLMGKVPLRARRLFFIWIPGISQPKNSLWTGTELDGPADAGRVESVAISLVEELTGEVTGAMARGNFLHPKLLEGSDDFLDLLLGHPSHVEGPDHKVDLVTRDFLRSFDHIYHPGVGTASDHQEPFRTLHHQCLLLDPSSHLTSRPNAGSDLHGTLYFYD
jgi:hypothetical protein